MEGILKVSSDKLRGAANEFSTTNGQVQSITSEMNSLVNGLSGVWTGEAAEAFKAKFNQLNDDMTRIHKMIDEHSKDLMEMATVYDEAEKTGIDAINGLQGDVIQ